MGKPIKPGEEEACLLTETRLQFPCRPSVSPIYPAAVYVCESTTQAEQLLGGSQPGYVYQRDGHPNADWLSDKCRRLHGADAAMMTSSGMAALSAVLLARVQSGDHIVISNQLYGRTSLVYGQEAQRLSISVTEVDMTDLDAVRSALTPRTRLVVTETISNPLIRVVDLPAIARCVHQYPALLVVDNTFATPLVCRPLELGADLVVESVSKLMNGHGDLMLGLVCGRAAAWDRIPQVIAAWGFAASPFDCWLAERGLATLGLRVERACRNAQRVASFLDEHPAVEAVSYPGLADHPDHELAGRQFLSDGDASATSRYGHMLAFHLKGDSSLVDRLIQAARQIEFCPSLGEIRTTLSHPASTSHRSLTSQQQRELGIRPGTVRLSLGIESEAWLVEQLRIALDSLDLSPKGR